MSILTRINRHAKLSLRIHDPRERLTPPFLILFINSICNLTCEHCFYWRNLNRRDDLTYEELSKLSVELGNFENLNLWGASRLSDRSLATFVCCSPKTTVSNASTFLRMAILQIEPKSSYNGSFSPSRSRALCVRSRWTECPRTMTGFGAIRGHLPKQWKLTTCWRKCRSESLAFAFTRIRSP